MFLQSAKRWYWKCRIFYQCSNMDLVINFQPVIVDVWVQTQGSLCGIFDRNSGTGTVFPWVLSVSVISTLQPTSHTHSFINDAIQTYWLRVQLNNESTHTHAACKVLHIRRVNIHVPQLIYCTLGLWSHIYNWIALTWIYWHSTNSEQVKSLDKKHVWRNITYIHTYIHTHTHNNIWYNTNG